MLATNQLMLFVFPSAVENLLQNPNIKIYKTTRFLVVLYEYESET
jgi:hypothetical protein